VENQAILAVEQLLSLPADQWPTVRLIVAPCLRLLRFEFPIDEYYRALREGQVAAPPDRADICLAINRRDYVVRHYRLTPPQHEILRALLAGEAVQTAVMRGAELVPDAAFDAFAGDLRSWFATWSAEGFFTAVEADSAETDC
jgi:hypothetical protein